MKLEELVEKALEQYIVEYQEARVYPHTKETLKKITREWSEYILHLMKGGKNG